MGLAGMRIIIRSKRFTAEIGVFRVMPLIRELLKFISFDVTYITEHKPGMHIQQRPDSVVFSMGI